MLWCAGCREGGDYERVLKVNVVGSFLVTQAFYALLKKRSTRTIVNVSSGVGSIAAQRAGSVPVAGKVIAYASSKAALNMRARPRLCQDRVLSFQCVLILLTTLDLHWSVGHSVVRPILFFLPQPVQYA